MSFHSLPKADPIESLNILKNSTLIVPNISIGNIPQLAIDLLLSNYNFAKIGYLDDLYVYPFASPIDTVDETLLNKGIAHSLEIFYNEQFNLTVIQQRSPILPGFTNTFVNELIVPFISTVEFGNVIILDSSDAGLIETDKKLEIYKNTIDSKFTKLNIDSKPIDELANFSKLTQLLIEGLNRTSSDKKLTPTPSDIKLTNILREKFPTSLPLSRTSSTTSFSESHLEISGILIYCYEGDNSNDAELLIGKLIEFTKIPAKHQFIKPVSWLGVYGDKPVPSALEEGLFG